MLGRRARSQEHLAGRRSVAGDAPREILTDDCARRSRSISAFGRRGSTGRVHLRHGSRVVTGAAPVVVSEAQAVAGRRRLCRRRLSGPPASGPARVERPTPDAARVTWPPPAGGTGSPPRRTMTMRPRAAAMHPSVPGSGGGDGTARGPSARVAEQQGGDAVSRRSRPSVRTRQPVGWEVRTSGADPPRVGRGSPPARPCRDRRATVSGRPAVATARRRRAAWVPLSRPARRGGDPAWSRVRASRPTSSPASRIAGRRRR